jgi:hypothetical protein
VAARQNHAHDHCDQQNEAKEDEGRHWSEANGPRREGDGPFWEALRVCPGRRPPESPERDRRRRRVALGEETRASTHDRGFRGPGAVGSRPGPGRGLTAVRARAVTAVEASHLGVRLVKQSVLQDASVLPKVRPKLSRYVLPWHKEIYAVSRGQPRRPLGRARSSESRSRWHARPARRSRTSAERPA